MDFAAWRCTNHPTMMCPVEGCTAAEGCARDNGWDGRQPGPPNGENKPREAERIAAAFRKFTAGYSRMLGTDPEEIYSIHRSTPHQAVLTVSMLNRAADLLSEINNNNNDEGNDDGGT